jgi:hypothetical protein
MTEPSELADRYVSVWNEPDPGRRRDAVRALWARGGAQVVEPPQEVREAGAALAMNASFRAHGHEELEQRVSRAYEEFVERGGFVFKSQGNAARLDHLVKFNWEMVPAGGGDVAAVGLEVLLLDDEGRIRADYQFIER